MLLLLGFPGCQDDLICVYFEGKHRIRKEMEGLVVGKGHTFVTVTTVSVEVVERGAHRRWEAGGALSLRGRQAISS